MAFLSRAARLSNNERSSSVGLPDFFVFPLPPKDTAATQGR